MACYILDPHMNNNTSTQHSEASSHSPPEMYTRNLSVGFALLLLFIIAMPAPIGKFKPVHNSGVFQN